VSTFNPTDRTPFWIALAFCSALLIAFGASRNAATVSAATRNTIEVYPGRHALSKALSNVHAGDILNIHAGTYPEAVTISKRVRLQAAGDGVVTVDGQCQTRFTITVQHNGVVIDGLRIVGANVGYGDFPSEVNFTNILTGTLKNSVLRDTCDAEYGVNVFSSSHIRIIHNNAVGFSDAGIYIGGITSTPGGALAARRNFTHGNNRGIIVEDSSGATIRVGANTIRNNDTSGIFLHNSDGIILNGNTLSHKLTTDVTYGIELDANSDNNQVAKNSSHGHTFDLANEGGSNNCFQDNSYTTSTGTVSC
jgi:parallel beta-helix repeat protein